MTLESLVTTDDPDWASYTGDDPDWFLPAAGRIIRKWCSWWIYPSQTVTVDKLRIGSRGLITLPAQHVTDVASVTIDYPNGDTHTLNPEHYIWHGNGIIEPACEGGWQSWSAYSGYWPYLVVWDHGRASVEFTAGYTDLPDDIKSVAFELAEQGMAIRNGNARQIDAPGGFRVITTQPFGLTLNPDQKNRLASYRIGWVA